MNSKDQRVLEILKSNRVLREIDLDLLSKVALRSLKDFAVPLRVTIAGKKEIFWKWHLLEDEDTNRIISVILNPPQLIQREASLDEIELNEEIKEEVKETKSIKIEEPITADSAPEVEIKKEVPDTIEIENVEKIDKVVQEESELEVKKEKPKNRVASKKVSDRKDKQKKLSERLDKNKSETSSKEGLAKEVPSEEKELTIQEETLIQDTKDKEIKKSRRDYKRGGDYKRAPNGKSSILQWK